MNIFRGRTFQMEGIARPIDRRKEKKIANRAEGFLGTA